jgi:hypothetical protein
MKLKTKTNIPTHIFNTLSHIGSGYSLGYSAQMITYEINVAIVNKTVRIEITEIISPESEVIGMPPIGRGFVFAS